MAKFKSYNQKNKRMLVIEPDKLLEEDHPARVIDEIIEKHVDMSEIYSNYSDLGRPAYHPKLMLKVLLYSYTEGVLSCRKMYKNVKHRADYKYLTGGDVPDFRTLNEFRKENLKELPKIFTQVVCLCYELDMINLENLAIDGQKIQANASYKKSYNKERLEKRYKKVKKGIKKLLSKDLEELDKKHKEKTKKRITKLEKEKEKLEKLKEKLDEIEEEEDDDDDDNNNNSASNNEDKTINMTDEDAKVMTHKDRTKKPSYNHLSAVDGKYGVTCAVKTKDTGDSSYDLLDLTEKVIKNLGKKAKNVLADSAFIRDELYPELHDREEEFYIPDTFKKRSEENRYDKSNFKLIDERNLECPEGRILRRQGHGTTRGIRYTIYKGENCKDCEKKEKCTNGKNRYVNLSKYEKEKARMRRKLNSKEGLETYIKRQGIIESSNGNDQKNQGWIQHHLRGLFKATKEFLLIRLGSNLKKITKYKPRECLEYLNSY